MRFALTPERLSSSRPLPARTAPAPTGLVVQDSTVPAPALPSADDARHRMLSLTEGIGV